MFVRQAKLHDDEKLDLSYCRFWEGSSYGISQLLHAQDCDSTEYLF